MNKIQKFAFIALITSSHMILGQENKPVENRPLPESANQEITIKREKISTPGKIHGIVGTTILFSSISTAIMGGITRGKYQNGQIVSREFANIHRGLAATTIALSLTNSGLGIYNLYKLKNEEKGKTKRYLHASLSSLATIGFSTAGILAADLANKRKKGTFTSQQISKMYLTHASIASLSTLSVIVTLGIIVW